MSIFSILGLVFLAVLVTSVVVWLVNRQAFRDFFGAGRAQVGKWGAAAKNADPQALIRQEIADAKSGLDTSVGDLEESMAMVTELEELNVANAREVATLDAKVKNSLSDDPDDRGGRAMEYVMQLNTAKENATKSTEQLGKARSLYSSNLERFRLAREKIAEAQRRASNLGVEVKSSETNKRLAELARKCNVDVSGLDSKLAEAEAETRRQIARNNAVSQVQADLGADGLAEAKEEKRLKEVEGKRMLEEYKQKMK